MFYNVVMFLTFVANVYPIISNGRYYIDDASRYQWHLKDKKFVIHQI